MHVGLVERRNGFATLLVFVEKKILS